MIPVRRNIDTDELVLWLDPDSPLSSSVNYNAYSIGRRGKNLFAGTAGFTNAVPPCSNGFYGPDIITPNNATVSLSAEAAPDGTTNKTYDLVESSDGSNKSHFLRYDYQVSPPISGGPYETYTHSLYVKVSSGGRTIRIQNSNNPNSGALTVDPATGTIIASDADNIDEGVESLGGGWYRIYYTIEISDVFTAESYTRLAIYLADATGNTSYQGDGTSSVLIYGNQFEKGTISNYTPGPEGEDFSVYTNKKMKGGTNENPGYYRTSFAGNNLRFNGVESAMGSSPAVRNPFRPGIHPNGDDNRWSLLSHSLFAWVKLDPGVNPQAGTTGTGVIATIIGNIGGKANNGVFGLNKEGTKILYKTRVRDTGGTQSFTNESSAFPTIYNTWTFIALSFDTAYGSNTATVDFYLNGQFLNTVFAFNLPTRTVRGIDGSSSGIGIGQFVASNQVRGLFKGLINICGTYNKALNATEHEALYNATKYRFHNN